jgi:hypothetical protein
MRHVNHQASHVVGSLVVEFTLQFTTYQMSNSRTKAFDTHAPSTSPFPWSIANTFQTI